jgi:hypothetical protein
MISHFHYRREHNLFTNLPDSSRSSHDSSPFQAEQRSLNSLRLLLIQSVEAISFILLLIDYQLPEIVSACSPELQKKLSELTYAELLTSKTGRDVARGLVSSVINQQIGRHLSVSFLYFLSGIRSYLTLCSSCPRSTRSARHCSNVVVRSAAPTTFSSTK